MKKKLVIYMLGLILLSSCHTKSLFQTDNTGHIADLINTEVDYHHVIKADDKVCLSIWNHDDMSIGSVFSVYNSNESFGKWIIVDKDGNIPLPKIGIFNIGGMTCPQAADSLVNLYGKAIVDPIIVVKVLNRDVTVLGEVRTPGIYNLDKERNTISEILGMAQGFAGYANLEKVQVIRNGISYELDMTTLDEHLLHAIIIEAGDVINVPSKNGKRLDQKAPTLIPFASTMTALAIVASILL